MLKYGPGQGEETQFFLLSLGWKSSCVMTGSGLPCQEQLFNVMGTVRMKMDKPLHGFFALHKAVQDISAKMI